MVAQESHPSFQLVGLRGTPQQVSRHCGLGDDETELGELSMDAWRPPAVLRHRADEATNLGINPRSTGMAALRDLCPVPSESVAIPTGHGVRVDDEQAARPHGPRPRRATQKARSVSSSGGRGRSFFSAVTCCRKATFSNTRSARRRHIARMARTPSETRKTTTLSIAAEFRRLRPGFQGERKSLISWAEQF